MPLLCIALRESWRTEGGRRVWYEFLFRWTAISKPVGNYDLWWTLQNIHDISAWERWCFDLSYELLTRHPEDVTNQWEGKKGGEGFHISFQMFWYVCQKHVINSLEMAPSCQGRNVKFNGRRKSTDKRWKPCMSVKWWVIFLFVQERQYYTPSKENVLKEFWSQQKASCHLRDGQSRGQEIFSQRSVVRPDVQAGKWLVNYLRSFLCISY